MNDRFKFRVWNKKNKRYTGNNASYSIDESGLLHVHIFGQHCELENTEDFEVEQCTGLKDKNGNLIYGNDLIKSPNNSHPLVVVQMANGLWGCKEYRTNGVYELSLFDLIKNYWVEIIGNIHEQKDKQ